LHSCKSGHKTGINEKYNLIRKKDVSIIEHSQAVGIKLKMKEHKLRSGVN
jgi:hypothetical protein